MWLRQFRNCCVEGVGPRSGGLPLFPCGRLPELLRWRRTGRPATHPDPPPPQPSRLGPGAWRPASSPAASAHVPRPS